jgi:tetratricopeptide (TPR) repeat protein
MSEPVCYLDINLDIFMIIYPFSYRSGNFYIRGICHSKLLNYDDIYVCIYIYIYMIIYHFPYRSGNYYLRGICHSKLLNYDETIEDFKLAETYGYSDAYDLIIKRGMTYRLLGLSLKVYKYTYICLYVQK